MQRVEGEIKQKAHELLKSGVVSSVLAWKKGDLVYDAAPAFFKSPNALEDMVYNGFCCSNLSKYLIEKDSENEKVLVFLKPCDTYSLNQLLSNHRVIKDKIYAVGIGCDGKIDIEKLRAKGVKGILEIEEDGESLKIQTLYGDETCVRRDILLEKCLNCKGKDHMVYDELIGSELSEETALGDKFSQVDELEKMSSDDRFEFWRCELSKCIRCNACRNVCPSCTCRKCVFDNPHSGVNAKVNVTDFEENMFHIIRAFHVAGRCSDCGECTRVCPQGIPLQLLNRKFIKDINNFYGDFQAGETVESRSPLFDYNFEDIEPNVISKGRGIN
ncbi:MAG: 4Fe-4S dicluster domain-containing protein [Defluviitaleaceae bacterium]|nr:4Fe-4S dicluster domain-containing protein [Defluviitaleaceae bacterium]